MNVQQPIIEQMQSLKEKTVNASEGLTDQVNSIKSGIQNNLGDFSSKGMKDASTEFLQSNGILAKCAFIILIFIIFLFLFKVGVQTLGYLLGPSKNPYIIYGKLDGSNTVSISQDPTNTASIPILRSNNRNSGIEFTWSVWLYLNLGTSSNTTAIFVKGNKGTSTSTPPIYEYETNGPGMYVKSDNGVGTITVHLDDVQGNTNKMEITNIPLQKWVHIAYRLQNTVLDVYVNGVVQNRLPMTFAPKQNNYDITVCGGFAGSLSNLRYYSSALNVFDINNIVMFGPNLNPSSLAADGKSAGNYSYLSNQWYTNTFQ